MNKKQLRALALAGICGATNSLYAQSQQETTQSRIHHAGHMYFNVGTGELLLTSLSSPDVQAPASDLGNEVWVIGSAITGCDSEPGSSSSDFFLLDTAQTSDAPSPMLLDWGDMVANTVIDCVQIHWITDHEDTDTNSDSFADGVEGFGATWTFWDGFSGQESQFQSTALPIVSFSFFNLPGEYPPSPDTVSFYTADIDLGSSGSFGTSLVFEIGDTDSDLGLAAFHNSRMDLRDGDMDGVADLDVDLDGLADWAWSIDFTQPGTLDLDNADQDSDPLTGIDGDLADFAPAGVALGLPSPGTAVFDEDAGQWTWMQTGIFTPTENAYGLAEDGVYLGPIPGFSGQLCDSEVDIFDVVIRLYGPIIDCFTPDLNGDGILDFFDVSYFLQNEFDYNGDTVFDFFDISAFLSDFEAGCP